MEIYSGGLIILPVSQRELTRQFRVLRQTLSMHTMLKDRYKKLAVTIDIILLACAVVFCATTFASDDVFSLIGLSPETVRFVLGVASILAFFASLVGFGLKDFYGVDLPPILFIPLLMVAGSIGGAFTCTTWVSSA